MKHGGSRVVVTAALSVLVTVATAIVVNVLTTGWHWVWWPVLGVLAVVNIGVLVLGSRQQAQRVTASGAGSVAAGGDAVGPIRTKARGTHAPGGSGGDGVTASGAGAVAAGGDVGDVHTDVE
jgi:hypothetical protein